ncbi:MAG: HPF/RaiA family ribosome-associated protein [Kofleriaceae bacterium]
MDLHIAPVGWKLEDPLRAWIHQRLTKIDARFGPVVGVDLVIEREQRAFENWHVRSTVSAFEKVFEPSADDRDLEAALDQVFSELAANLRAARWARDGVSEHCRWCDGDEYLHFARPIVFTHHHTRQPFHFAAEGNEERGMLEVLMCRNCGHVEWFSSDPGRVSPKQPGATIVKARPKNPYR